MLLFKIVEKLRVNVSLGDPELKVMYCQFTTRGNLDNIVSLQIYATKRVNFFMIEKKDEISCINNQ